MFYDYNYGWIRGELLRRESLRKAQQARQRQEYRKTGPCLWQQVALSLGDMLIALGYWVHASCRNAS
jgi:hypothetical protein